MTSALELIVKASAVLALGGVIHIACRHRASAAIRHLLLALTLASALLLPFASLIAPQWPIRLAPLAQGGHIVVATRTPLPLEQAAPIAEASTEPLAVVEMSPSSAAPAPVDSSAGRWSWSTAAIALYLTGVIAMLLYGIAQQWTLRRFVRRAHVVDDAGWLRLVADDAAAMGVRGPVRLLRTREHNVPLVFGLRPSSIVIPLIAETWTDERRHAVLRHELAHVARHDSITQLVAFACCTLYWFHPLAWLIAGRLRIEAELACDDCVIAAGTEAREYAGHLLEIAYSLGGGRAPAVAIAMARPRQLEGRMLAALDRTRNRRGPRVGFSAATGALALLVMGALAGAKPVTATVVHIGESGAPVGERSEPGEAREISESTQDAGTWEIRPARTEGMVHLRIVEQNSSSGTNVPITQFEGLTAAQLTGAGGPIQFRLRRDAGTFTFEGVIRRGVGAGPFSFTPDANFANELAKRGFARPNAGEQYQMARSDIGYAFVDELNRQGYAKPAIADLVRAGQHGVNTTYLRDMGALGYRLGSLDPLITLRDHGVNPDYVRALAELGYKGLSADAIREARDHGVSAEYVRAMREAGYGSLPMDALINARDHGVSAEFVRGLAEGGYRNLPLEEVIRVRDHGVSAEYVRDMRQLGHNLAIGELVNARDHGVSVEFARALAALGYKNLPMTTLVRARDHGVSVQYVRDLRALGYNDLSLDDLIYLRDHGLSVERIKDANARAGTRLPIDLLRALAR